MEGGWRMEDGGRMVIVKKQQLVQGCLCVRALSARPDRRVSEGGQTVTAESNGLTRILGRVCVRSLFVETTAC
jgi:hypothetical protein